MKSKRVKATDTRQRNHKPPLQDEEDVKRNMIPQEAG